MFMGNLRIGTRLGLAFAVVLIMVLGIIALAVSRLDSQDTLISTFANERVPQVVNSHKWAITLLESAGHTRNIFVLDHGKIPDELSGMEDQRKRRIDLMNKIERVVDTAQGEELFKNVADAHAIYAPDEDEFVRLVQANRLEEAKKLLTDKVHPEQLTYLGKIYTLSDYQVSLISKERGEAKIGTAADGRRSSGSECWPLSSAPCSPSGSRAVSPCHCNVRCRPRSRLRVAIWRPISKCALGTRPASCWRL